MLPEQSVERLTASLLIRMRQSIATQKIPAIFIGHRQRIALRARTQFEPALEISSPDGIRRVLGRQAVGIFSRSLLSSRRRDEAFSREDRTDGRCRRAFIAAARDPCLQLARSPPRVAFPRPHHQLDHVGRRLVRMRSPASWLIPKTWCAPLPEALQPLVASLSADPVSAAQNRDALEAFRQPIFDKSNPCFHFGDLFPRHPQIVCIAAEVSPMKPVCLSPMKPVRTQRETALELTVPGYPERSRSCG
jgi:hypothetical protein